MLFFFSLSIGRSGKPTYFSAVFNTLSPVIKQSWISNLQMAKLALGTVHLLDVLFCHLSCTVAQLCIYFDDVCMHLYSVAWQYLIYFCILFIYVYSYVILSKQFKHYWLVVVVHMTKSNYNKLQVKLLIVFSFTMWCGFCHSDSKTLVLYISQSSAICVHISQSSAICVCVFCFRGGKPAGLVLCRGRWESDEKAETSSAASTDACGHVKATRVQGETSFYNLQNREDMNTQDALCAAWYRPGWETDGGNGSLAQLVREFCYERQSSRFLVLSLLVTLSVSGEKII